MGTYFLLTTEHVENDASFRDSVTQLRNTINSSSYMLTFNVSSVYSHIKTKGYVEAYQRVGEKNEFTLKIYLSDSENRKKSIQLLYKDNMVYKKEIGEQEKCTAHLRDYKENLKPLLDLIPSIENIKPVSKKCYALTLMNSYNIFNCNFY